MLSTDLARPSVPTAGRTVQEAIARLSQPFYEASLRWVSETDEAAAIAAARRFQRRYSIGPVQVAEPSESGTARIVSFLLCALLAARLSRRASVSCSFAEAEQWFLGGVASDETVSTSNWPSGAVYLPLSSVSYDERLADAFPFVGEVFVTGPTGPSRSSRATHRNNRLQKRRTGVFYTPGDLADFLARGAVTRWKALTGADATGRLPRCVDPACGTGILLRSVLDALASDGATHTAEERLAIASQYLLGIDMNVVALDVCAFALLVWCQRSEGEFKQHTPFEAWRAIRTNLLHCDAREFARAFWLSGRDSDRPRGHDHEVPEPPRQLALHLSTSLDRSRQAACMLAHEPFDLVIANPPFAQLSHHSGSTVRRSTYAPFVRMMWLLSRKSGSVGAIVVPLSIAYSSLPVIREVRGEVAAIGGTWEFAFFDRTPDSLFGDDVKTRAATAYLTRDSETKTLVGTTSLLRWNSRDRQRLFESIRFVWLPHYGGDSVLPKLGSLGRRVRTQ